MKNVEFDNDLFKIAAVLCVTEDITTRRKRVHFKYFDCKIKSWANLILQKNQNFHFVLN